jgi:hypothetical protein
MDDRDIEESIDDRDLQVYRKGREAIENILSDPPPRLVGDIHFEETPGGFEVHYSDRIASEHQDRVDQSADWLEDQLGLVNLGQVDYKILMADGRLTDEVKNGLIVWWAERVQDLSWDNRPGKTGP